MKALFAIVAFGVAIAANAQVKTPVPTANEILQPAVVKATAGKKNVFLIFQASWCSWCRKMDASLQDPAVKPLIDQSYEVVHLTAYESPNKKHLENPGAVEFLEKHGGADKGLPYWYILDKEGNVLNDSKDGAGQNTGCPASEEEVAYLISVIKKTSSLTDDQLRIIQQRFRQNE